MAVLTPEQIAFVLSKVKYALANITPAETVAANAVNANSAVAQNATVAQDATVEAAPAKKFVAQNASVEATEEVVPVKKVVAQEAAPAEAYTSSGGRRKRTKRVKRAKRRRGTRR